MGCSGRCHRLSRLGKAMQRAKGWGTVTQLPAGTKPCPATTVTLFSCPLHSRAAEGSARNALPARPHIPSPSSPRRPSAQPCMWVHCSLLAQSERTYSLQCPRGQPQWGGGVSGLKMRAALAPRLVSQSWVACAGSGAGGSVFEATKLCAPGCPDQCSFPSEALAPCLPQRKNQCPEGDGGHLGVFIRAGEALCLTLGAGMQNMKHAQSPFRGAQGQDK